MGGTCSTHDVRIAKRILVPKPEGRIQLGRPRHRWQSIKCTFRKWATTVMDYIYLAQVRKQWLALRNKIIRFSVLWVAVVGASSPGRLLSVYQDDLCFIELQISNLCYVLASPFLSLSVYNYLIIIRFINTRQLSSVCTVRFVFAHLVCNCSALELSEVFFRLLCRHLREAWQLINFHIKSASFFTFNSCFRNFVTLLLSLANQSSTVKRQIRQGR